MIRIREAIIVEGRYDKNTLAQVVDAPILETSGFGIFHDSQRLMPFGQFSQQSFVKRLGETRVRHRCRNAFQRQHIRRGQASFQPRSQA